MSRRHLLTELIVSLIFFFFCTAVCLGLFAQAHDMSLRSRRLTAAVSLAQSAAQGWQGLEDADALAGVLELTETSEGLLEGRFDQGGQPQAQGEYLLRLDASTPHPTITVLCRDEIVYALSLTEEDTP